MNNSFPRRRRQASPRAVQRARELVEELCLDRVEHIEPEKIAYARGADGLIRKPLRGEQARLVRSAGGGVVIAVNENLRPEQERFAILHEVGHLELHPELDQFKACSKGDMTDYYGDGREAEANHFSAEMLMPRKLFAPRCDVRQPSLDVIERLAADFRASFMATGIRFVQHSSEPCAFLYSRDGEIAWSAESDSFPLFIKRGWGLPYGDEGNYAGDFHAGRGTPPVKSTPVNGDSWSDSWCAQDRSVYEHSRGWVSAANHTFVLTLLWVRD
jgi:hypothetical protein